jgi:capsule polysaccharide export protein KpsE/RkpR
MRELLDQGVVVSRDIASKAGEKAQDWGEKGYHASKEFLSKAGTKAQDLGERGVLMMEVRQLEGRAQKLIAQLGAETYKIFTDQSASAVSADTPEIKTLLAELASVREAVEKRESELQIRKAAQ